MRVITGEIWCCCNAADIVVYDDALKWKRNIQLTNASAAADSAHTYVHDVAMMTHGDLVIATSQGLYQTDIQG